MTVIPPIPEDTPSISLSQMLKCLSTNRINDKNLEVVPRVDKWGNPAGSVITTNKVYKKLPYQEFESLISALYFEFDVNDNLLHVRSYYRTPDHPINPDPEFQYEPQWFIDFYLVRNDWTESIEEDAEDHDSENCN